MKDLIHKLRMEQPCVLNRWKSHKVVTVYSAKLYMMWLKRVTALLHQERNSQDVLIEDEMTETMKTSLQRSLEAELRDDKNSTRTTQEPLIKTDKVMKARGKILIQGIKPLASLQPSGNLRNSLLKQENPRRIKAEDFEDTTEPLKVFSSRHRKLSDTRSEETLKMSVVDQNSPERNLSVCGETSGYSLTRKNCSGLILDPKPRKWCTTEHPPTKLLKDDPLWSSGCLSTPHVGTTPKTNFISTPFCSRFSPIGESLCSNGILSLNEFKTLAELQRKSFPDSEKQAEFLTPQFSLSQPMSSQMSLTDDKDYLGLKNFEPFPMNDVTTTCIDL